ncbi:hypothetical protein DAPPUDRAFT_104888 [Daphnia pulex]|uniref:Uncharacterized protein n=1 Tax=Daphnia pulex TaxID=6669 RepID=E9GNN2_DAPPU|nr:hypothetical protein DAPPUDRAFT_104888 [Daphnia pulex]|eukprot:EFX78933.1 hypothetical protein DAPPUDRAFT_104888 [Daphnia pulex]
MQKVASSDIKSSLARTRQNKEEQSPSTSREFRCGQLLSTNKCYMASVLYWEENADYIQEGGGWSRLFIETHLFVYGDQRALFLNTYSLSPRFELGPSRMVGILVNQPSDRGAFFWK